MIATLEHVWWQSATESVPCAGHEENGDRVWIASDADGWRALVIDVSGHGAPAHACCQDLERSGAVDLHQEPTTLLLALHRALHGSRGAAAMVVDVRPNAGDFLVRYAGVGNVRIWGGGADSWSGEGQAGMLGARIPGQLRTTSRTLRPGDHLAIVTDGIRSEGRSYLADSADAAERLAGEVVRRFARAHDDATCVVLGLRRRP